MTNEPDDDNGGRRLLLRVVAWLLAALIAGELLLVLGRGLMCALRGGCPNDEIVTNAEILSGLLATLIALVFAVLGRTK
jgi:hypothetical protein